MMNEPKAQKILPNFGFSAKLHTDVVMLQSLHFSRAPCNHPPSCILWSPPPAVFRFGCSAKLHPDVVVLQSIPFSRALYDHPPSLHPLEPSSGCIPLGAHARLPSACAFCTSLYPPPA